jgi:NADPH2:quinone reductase
MAGPDDGHTVRAWQAAAHGEPRDVLTLADVPEPQPGAGQLLVRVRATALNFPDVLLCRGTYQVRPPLPFTPGVELCGEVVGVGEGVTGISVGDRVIGVPALPHGSLADLAVMDAVDAFGAPPELGDAAAAALHIAYQTGWFALHRRARLQPGETLLVHAAAGGVGSAAIQLGKAAEARVIGVVGGPAKAKVAVELGADAVVDRHEQDFVAAVKDLTGGRGADVIFDPVGGDAYAGSTRCIAFEGRIVVVGFAGGTIPEPALSHVLIKNYSILGLHWGLYKRYELDAIRAAHDQLSRLVAAGTIAPLIGDRLPLDAAVDGLTRLAAGDSVGRLVVLP